MKRCLFILFILSFVLNHSIALETGNNLTLPDSLAGKLREFQQNDDSRAKALIDIIEFCLSNHQQEAALPYIKELRNLKYYTEGDYYQIALCDYYYACYLCNTNQLEEAMKWTERSLNYLENATENVDTRKLVARISLTKGACLFDLNLYSEEYNCLQEGIEMAEINQDSILLGKLYNDLGIMYQNIYRIDEAFDGLYKSLRYYPNNYSALINLSANHSIAKEMDSTYQYFDSAYIYLEYALQAAKDKHDSVLIYHHIGMIKAQEKDYDEAENFLTSAMEGYEQCNSELYDLCIIRRELAFVEKSMGNLDRALEFINEAIQMGEIGEELKALYYSYSIRYEIRKQMGDYKSALGDAEKLIETTDKIVKLRSEDKLVKNEIALMARKNHEQLQFEQFKAKQKQRTTWIVSGLIVFFSLLITVLLVLFNRKRRRVLELELNAQHREMTSKVLNQMRINETLQEVVKQLDQIKDAPEKMETDLSSMIRNLNEMVDDGSKKDFDYYFVQVHPSFYNNLKKDFPDLTPNDLRLCAFIKAKLSTKEIADLNHMSADSVKNSRSRLRKKLGLTDSSISIDSIVSKY